MTTENNDAPLRLDSFLGYVADLKVLREKAIEDGTEAEFLCAAATCTGLQASQMESPHRQLGLASKWLVQGFLSDDDVDGEEAED
jgi:hypothetical protein